MAHAGKAATADQVLRQAEEFFMGKDAVHGTLRRLREGLEQEGIDYAVVGGMALALHGYVRTTQDVDLLLTPAGLDTFHQKLVGRGYVLSFAGARRSFQDAETRVPVEILVTGEYPGDGKPKPVSFPEPVAASVDRDGYRLIRLEKLIELKLASGLTAPHRLRDLADVQDLIRILGLEAELAERLSSSVRDEYLRLWRSVHESLREPAG
jgi:Uncharacterised nucleotidyltransferase